MPDKLRICWPMFFDISSSRNAPEFARLAYLGRHAQVTLLTRRGNVIDPELLANLTVRRCPLEISRLKDDAFYLVNFTLYLFWALGVVGWLRLRRRVDILYSMQTPDSLVCVLHHALGCPWVVDILDLPHLYASNLNAQKRRRSSFFPGLRSLLLSVMKWVIAKADRVVTTAFGPDEGFAKTLRQECGVAEDKLVLVTNGVNLDFTRPAGLPERDDCFDVFYVGLVSRLRGLDTLLQAAATIKDDIPDLRLTLVGPTRGDDAEWLQQRSAELGLQTVVEFLGEMPHRDVLRHMEGAHVCVNTVPRTIEHDGTHRIKMFEYLAMGKAVVASRLAGSARIVNEGENGLLVEPEDHQALAAAILRLYRQPELRQRLRSNARPSVLKFDFNLIARKVLQTLEIEAASRAS